MGGSSKKQTVGYKYYLGAHMAICQGPVDYLTEVQVDRRQAYCGELSPGEGDTQFTISAESLFGGDSREGGISGTVDLLWGSSSQGQNAYLQTQLGTDIPAFRGVFSVVLNQVYVGNNPYLKPWAFRVQRINATTDGSEQWNPDLSTCAASFGYDCATLTALLQAGNGTVDEMADEWTTVDSAQPPFSTFIPSAYSSAGLVLERVSGVALTDWASDYEAVENPYPTASGYELCEGGNAGWVVEMTTTAPGGFDAALFEKSLASINDNTTTMAAVIASSSGDGAFTMNRWLDKVGRFPVTESNVAGAGIDQRIWIYSGRNGGALDQLGTIFTFRHVLGWAGAETDDNTEILEVPYIEPGTICYVTASATKATSFSRVEFSGTIGVNDFYDCWLVTTGTLCIALPDGTKYSKTSQVEGYAGSIRVPTGGDPPATIEDATAATQSNFRGYPSILNSGSAYLYAYAFGRYTFESSVTMADIPSCAILSDTDTDACGPCNDMNPAHIIRECLTDTRWGMGYAESDVDDNSFSSAATTLYNEGLCMSILWDREATIEEFIGEVLRHIDGVIYVSRRTGQFVLKLIREEADSNTLILDESNVSEVQNVKRPTLSELTNAISVIYWDMGADVQEAITVHNEALRQIQGQEISTTIQYPGFTRASVARKAADRDIRQLSTPLMTCEVKASREAQSLNIGDVFYLDWPDLEINSLLMRVEEIDYGDGINNAVTISAIEDVFGVPATTTTADQESLWTDPASVQATASQPRLLTEAPYYALAQTLGQLDTDVALADNPDLGYLMIAGGRQAAEFIGNVYTDAGAGYELAATIDFAPYTFLDGDLTEVTTEAAIRSSKDIDLVVDGTLAYIGDEIVQVSSVNQDSSGGYVSLTLVRGCLDTVPVAHNDGDPVIFWEDFAESPSTQYVAGEEVSAKIRTTVEENELALASAPADSVQFDSRAYRQFPPGNFRIDGLYYPQNYVWTGSHSLTWNHRSRYVLSFGGVFGHAQAGDVTSSSDNPEYIVEVWALFTNAASYDREKIFEQNVGDATSYDIDFNSIDGDSIDSNFMEVPDGTERIEITVTTLENGYRSWQSAKVTLQVPPFTDSVGDSTGVDSVAFDSVGLDSVGPWLPDQLSGLMAWLDASDAATITESGGAVSQWNDKSGNGNNATQGTGSAQPTTNASTQNSLNVLDFDGGDYLSLGTILGKPSTYTMFVVGKINSLTGGHCFAGACPSSGAQSGAWGYLLRRDANGDKVETGFSDGVNSRIYHTTNNTLAAAYQLHSTTFAGSNDCRIYSPDDNEALTDFLGTGTSNGGTAYEYAIGRLGAYTVDFYLTGGVAEFVFFNRDLSDTERQRVEGYLAHKWGLAGDLDAGHPYKSAPPQSDYDSAG